MKPTKKKPARVKARIRVIHEDTCGLLFVEFNHKDHQKYQRISVLPRDPASKSAMVEQGVKAIRRWESNRYGRAILADGKQRAMIARAVLSSIGLLEGRA